MRVIISGGGLSGLTLASSLEKAGIDYVLLEARDCVDPQIGASIAMGASSMRILDQLGAADEINEQNYPVVHFVHYDTAFLDRSFILRAIANTIKDQSKVLLNKRVRSVLHTDTGVTVQCEDGSSVSGDILVGCDGVHSKVRSEMWRIADEVEPGYFDPGEKTKMTAEYGCLFGISEGMDKLGLTPGDAEYTYDKDRASLVYCGKNGRTYWFFFFKLARIYNYNDPDFPRFTREDTERQAAETFDRPFHVKLKFRDLWESRISSHMVPMEECLFQKWSWGRMAVVGDGSHKMTANHGAAGNNAIESAIAMANALQRLQEGGDLSTQTIHKTLVGWQAKRQARINDTYKGAAMICRLQCQQTWIDYAVVHWILPNATSLLSDIWRDQMIGAELLEYLPVPERSFKGNMPFNPKRGVGFEPNLKKRAAFGLPILAIWVLCMVFSPGGSGLVPPAGILNRAQSGGFLYLTDFGLMYAIWLMEGARYGNVLSLMQM
jgi:2-polyprenyl-6-methoxyphenol hydroxylase-like FAD-dependent oxidoreductase